MCSCAASVPLARCVVDAPARGALAVPLDTLTAPPPPAGPRVWYRPERAPIPEEPGRLVFNALLNEARHVRLQAEARGRRAAPTSGDDRIEARAYALKRWLWRLGHAARSGRFACSIEQLAVGVAPAIGWTVPPVGPERERWVRARRKSVQRWLADLQQAGVIAVSGELDNRGQRWRTVVELRAAPEPTAERLAAAQRRERAWKRRVRRARRLRERRRRAQRAGARRDPGFEGVRARAVRPRRSTRRRMAVARCAGTHERRRRAAVEAVLAAARERVDRGGDIPTHPFGAPPTSAPSQSSSNTNQKDEALVEVSGVRARAAPSSHATSNERCEEECTEEKGSRAVLGAEEFGAVIEARVATRRAATAWQRDETTRQAVGRAVEVASWPAGQSCPIGRLREAWAVFAAGAEVVGDSGPAVAGRVTVGLERRAARAVALYEAHAPARPPGWPASGACALTVLAAQRRAASLAGDVQRLLNLAKDMRALERHADPERVAAARRRAHARDAGADSAGASGRLRFRLRRPGRPRLETPEGRRRRVRDELLRGGEHPGLSPHVFDEAWRAAERHDAGELAWGDPDLYRLPDGMTERARRYQRELAAGRWPLPASWPTPAPTRARRRP